MAKVICDEATHCYGCEDYRPDRPGKYHNNPEPHCPSCALTKHREGLTGMKDA